ncbi:hypothetical protein FRC01_013074 [Tulasnella sp. 417]|nr:hypothetical protein FRC01_013074 [Tulasnella sp. 417]
MDIWEANSISNTYTLYPCDPVGPYKCTRDECGQASRYSGICDPDGCGFNPYRQGDMNFYGPSKIVDTTKKITLVTQFITDNGTTEIRRLHLQNGVVIANDQTSGFRLPTNSQDRRTPVRTFMRIIHKPITCLHL